MQTYNHLSETAMVQFSATILNDFFAHHLSDIQKLQLPDVAEAVDYRFVFALNYSLSNTKFAKAALVSAVVSAMRHSFAAANDYRSAAEGIALFVGSLPDHQNLGSFGRALSRLESCILHSYIAALCLQKFQQEVLGEGIFKKKDGSEYDRLRILNNRIKHYDEDVERALAHGEQISPSAIWLTDHSVECSETSLSLSELKQILDIHSSYCRQLASNFFKDPTRVPKITV